MLIKLNIYLKPIMMNSRMLVFNYTLDTLSQGLYINFKQDTLDLIHAVEMLTNLSTETTNYDLLSKYYGI